MKHKLKGVLGIGLAFMLVASLMAFAAPVAAADYEENDWGEWGLPAIEPDTDVGPIAVAPDGTLYAGVDTTSYPVTLPGASLDTLGSYNVEITVEDTGTAVTWTVDFPYDNNPGNGSLVAGLVIALDGEGQGPAYQIHNNDGVCAAFDWGTWLLSPWDPGGGWFGWHSGEEAWNTEVADIGWISASGDRYNFDNPDNVLTISIDKCRLGKNFHWALFPTIGSGFFGNPYEQFSVPDAAAWDDPIVDMGTPNYMYAELDGPVDLYKSDDGGFTWDETELEGAIAPIVDIAISPNYKKDETVYVGCLDGTVYRVEEAGEGDVIALKTITDNDGIDASQLFSLDVWTGEDDYNWVLVGTDIDVLVIKDKRFEDWRDQELNKPAYEVAFAPDFDDSELIWAVTVDADDFLVTSTVSPGKWGQEVGNADIPVTATPFLDIGFPDDYDSDPDTGDTNLWLAVSGGADSGDIFLIEGVDAGDGDSNAIAMFTDIGGETAADFISIAVSGDYGDEVILAGELNSPTIWISDDGGYSWDTVDKSPTGEGWTHVVMAPGAFDPDNGVAYASTFGNESAVSKSTDGGQVYNQVGLIDTEIDEIIDLGFHPDFPSDSIFLMITEDDDYGTYSLWLTENGDEDEPDYERVLCAGAPGNFAADSLKLVEFSQDGDAIYLFGNDGTKNSIWKSTNDGQTFGKKRAVKGDAEINDWAITDDRTIYAAVDSDSDYGFYKTVNSGLSWQRADTDDAMNDIALSPDFDSDETILLGGTAGEVFISDDAGDSFDDTGAGLSGDVFVAFDPDYADEDSDGFELIYAVGNDDNAIQVGEEDGDDTSWDVLLDDTNDTGVTGYFYGLQVSADRALYAIAHDADYDGDVGDFTGETGVVRLLLDESNSIWEYADGLTAPKGLWLTPGSNVLWTIDVDELWVLEDTLSGQVTLDSPPDGAKLDQLDVARISWKALRGADDDYEYRLNETSGLGIDIGTASDPLYTDATAINVEVFPSSEYDWKVRVAPGEPWHSRWSDTRSFHTALGAPPWSPTLYTPGGVWQYSGLNVELMPAFSWERAKNSDGYQFVLADNAEFTSPLVNEKTPESAYNLDFELEYNSNYFWRVMAYKGNTAISRWSDIGAFTTIEKAVAPPAPAPPATVTQPAPAPIVIPTPIPPALLWTIIGIGALLIIAVVVLIVRTRRPV